MKIVSLEHWSNAVTPKYKSGCGTVPLANSRENILSSMGNAKSHIWLLTGGHFISALI
jgi:hypothetical protein